MTPSLQIDFQQVIVLRMTYQLVTEDGLLAVRLLRIVSIRFVLLLVAHHPMSEFAFELLRTFLHDGPIRLLHLTITKHIIQTSKRLTGFG